MISIQQTNNCFACGACVDICAKEAICLKENGQGYLYPVVDKKKCVSCGACERVCIAEKSVKQDIEYLPMAYISRSNDKERYNLSASGGIFGTLAFEFIRTNGIVYGAAITHEDNLIRCKHVRIESTEELYKLQGSKYVHSETTGVFSEVLKDLKDGYRVLFSGTSCQVAALKNFLGKNYDTLYTVDLVCHGVPPISLLQKYVKYIENKHKCYINDISFRRKTKPGYELNKDSFVLTLSGQKNRNTFEECINRKSSGYYNLFLSRAGYRPNCYSCPFATIYKEGDITLGDFAPKGSEFSKYELSDKYMYSTVLINNDHGKNLYDTITSQCFSKEIEIDSVLRHHPNLTKPSRCNRNGKIMMNIYTLFGFTGLEKYMTVRERIKTIYHSTNNKGKKTL